MRNDDDTNTELVERRLAGTRLTERGSRLEDVGTTTVALRPAGLP